MRTTGMEHGARGREEKPSNRASRFRFMGAVFLGAILSAAAPAAFADDMVRMIEEKRLELKDKEELLRREEQRLNILKKEVDEKIETYARLLASIETAIKKVEQVQGEKIENVVKAYEVMPPEDAAVRLAALDETTALLIMTRMKSKKAGAVMAVMEPRKAASLTRSMTIIPVK